MIIDSSATAACSMMFDSSPVLGLVEPPLLLLLLSVLLSPFPLPPPGVGVGSGVLVGGGVTVGAGLAVGISLGLGDTDGFGVSTWPGTVGGSVTVGGSIPAGGMITIGGDGGIILVLIMPDTGISLELWLAAEAIDATFPISASANIVHMTPLANFLINAPASLCLLLYGSSLYTLWTKKFKTIVYVGSMAFSGSSLCLYTPSKPNVQIPSSVRMLL